MTSRYRVSLNNSQLDGISSSIMILDIQHSQPERTFVKQTNANLDGVHITDTYVGQRTITITFELHIYDIAKRNSACQRINAWAAAGGTLRTNDRTDQYLVRVQCEQYADISSARNWTDPLTLVFATTDCPYWVSATAKTRTITGKSAASKLTLDGNVGSALVAVTVTTQEKITNLTLKVDNTKLVLKKINVPKGKTVTISYTKGRYLKITYGNTSLMPKLDPSSSDSLLMVCGKADSAVSASADGKISTVFTARGLWL